MKTTLVSMATVIFSLPVLSNASEKNSVTLLCDCTNQKIVQTAVTTPGSQKSAFEDILRLYHPSCSTQTYNNIPTSASIESGSAQQWKKEGSTISLNHDIRLSTSSLNISKNVEETIFIDTVSMALSHTRTFSWPDGRALGYTQNTYQCSIAAAQF